MDSFAIGISGLEAALKGLSVVGNNIAPVTELNNICIAQMNSGSEFIGEVTIVEPLT